MHVAPGPLARCNTDTITKGIRTTELQLSGLLGRRAATFCEVRIDGRAIEFNRTSSKKLDIQSVVLVERAMIHKFLHGINTYGLRRNFRPQHLCT